MATCVNCSSHHEGARWDSRISVVKIGRGRVRYRHRCVSETISSRNAARRTYGSVPGRGVRFECRFFAARTSFSISDCCGFLTRNHVVGFGGSGIGNPRRIQGSAAARHRPCPNRLATITHANRVEGWTGRNGKRIHAQKSQVVGGSR